MIRLCSGLPVTISSAALADPTDGENMQHAASDVPSAGESTWLGHPKGLFLLFSTEMWERFSYYGMRSLLVLFLTHATMKSGFGWSGKDALSLYGTYTMLVFVTPLIGGWLADNVIGQRKALYYGSILIILGHFLLTGPHLIPQMMGSDAVPVTRILETAGVPMGKWLDTDLGNGTTVKDGLYGHVLHTTNAQLEGPDPDLVNKNFDIVKQAYLGITASFYGGLLLVILGTGFFKPNISTMVGHLYAPGDARRDGGFTLFYMGINIGAALGGLVAGYLGEKLGWHYGFGCASVGMLVAFLIYVIFQHKYLGEIGNLPMGKATAGDTGKDPLTAVERDRLKVIFVMGVLTIIFWVGFEQAGGAMNLYTFEHADRFLMGFEIPATWFQTLNPVFIVLFAPLVAGFWSRMGDRDPGTPVKFAIGMALLATGFLCMMGAALEQGGAGGKCSMFWIVGAYFFHTMGELCLSPVGLSMVTKLAPLRLASVMMGAWFLFIAAANKLAGWLGGFTEDLGALTLFGGIAVTAFICAGIVFCLSNRLIDWMHGAEGTDPAV